MIVICQNCGAETELEVVRGQKICPKCHMINPLTRLPEGTKIAGFEIRGFLGSGGMGVVYRALQLNLERMVALKVLNDSLASDHEFVTRFFREARAAAALSHPNIVQAYDAGVGEAGVCYFAMELIEGETYDLYIEKYGKLPEPEVRQIALKISKALSYAWERERLSHGDIKPENLIQDDLMGVKLSDLGLAKSSHEVNGADSVMATPLYAPPEIVSGAVDQVNVQSDMYSLGATLYHMLTGSPLYPDTDPYRAASHHVTKIYKPLSNFGVSASFKGLIDSLLYKNPAERPKTWADVVAKLEIIVTEPVRHERVIARKWIQLISGAAILAVIIVLGIAAIFLFKSGSESSGGGMIAQDEYMMKWNLLNARPDMKNPDKALTQVEHFLKTLPTAHPLADTVRMMRERLSFQISQVKNEREKRNQMRDAEIQKILSPIEIAEKENWQKIETADLLKTISDIQQIEKSVEKEKVLTFPAGTDLRIENLLRNMYAELAERSKSDIAERNEVYLKSLRKIMDSTKIVAVPQMMTALEDAAASNAYYQLISTLFSESREKGISAVSPILETWVPANPLSISALKSVDFMRKIFSEKTTAQEVIVAQFSLFNGRNVPASFPESVRGYLIDGISKDGRPRFYLKDGQTGAKIYKNLSFIEIGYDGICDMVKFILVPATFEKLTSPQKSALISFVCLSPRDDMRSLLLRAFSEKTDEYAVTAVHVTEDFSNAQKNLAAVQILDNMIAAIKSGDPLLANTYAVQLESDTEISFLSGNSFSTAVAAVKAYVSNGDPLVKYAELQAENANKDKVTLTAMGRYEELNAFSESDRSALNGAFENALKRIASAAKITGADNPRLPMAPDVGAGEALCFYEAAQRRQTLQYPTEKMRFISVVSAMDAGKWRSVKIALRHPAFISRLEECRNSDPYSVSVLYAFAVAAAHYGDEKNYQSIISMMKDVLEKEKDRSSADMRIALTELAIQRGDFEEAEKIAAAANSALLPTVSVRLGILSLIASASCAPDEKTFDESLSRALKQFRQLSMPDAVMRCQMIRSMVRRSHLILNARDISRLISDNDPAGDLWSRLLMRVTAQRIVCKTPSFVDWKTFFETILNRMPDNLAGAAAWRDYSALQIVFGIENNYLTLIQRQLMLTPGVQTLPGYHRALLLQLASNVSLKELSADGAQKIFLRYLERVPLAPEYLNDVCGTVLRAESPSRVTDALSRFSPEEAFYLYFPAMVAGSSSSNLLPRAEAFLSRLSPTERLLIQTLRKNWN